MKAKSKEQYLETWRSHLREMVHVALDGEIPYDEYQIWADQGLAMIEKAATANWPEPTVREQHPGAK